MLGLHDPARAEFNSGPNLFEELRPKALLAGDHLPLVVISHGFRGSFVGHHDVAEALANSGFIVAAIIQATAVALSSAITRTHWQR